MLGKFLLPNFSDSYMLQMTTIHSLKCRSVLEFGPGECFCANNLRTVGYTYHTVDILSKFEPTYLCSFEDFNKQLLTQSYDIVATFQMLEHVPYSEFLAGLKKLAGIANKYIVISLPYSCNGSQSFNYKWKGQFNCITANKTVDFKPTNLPERSDGPTGGHYWEIGRNGKTIESVSLDITATGLKIIKQFHSPNPYHYFYVIEV